MHYLGIDVGGMSVKAGVVCSDGRILYKTTSKIYKNVISSIDNVVLESLKWCNNHGVKIQKAGIGVPCIFEKKTGVVTYGNNLDFNGVNLRSHFLNNYNLDLEIANDASVAALGEYRFGACKEYSNVVLLTIGTGVGCGILLDGKIINSNSSAVGELSHTVIQMGGRKCSCGQRGCVEAYCSMTALYKDMIWHMSRDKSSLLWDEMDLNNIDGKILFSLYGKDKTATLVIERFLKYLKVVVVNVANLIRPDIIVIGGAVSAQGNKIIEPLNDYLNKNLFAKDYTQTIPIVSAKNGNDAGILGAASLLI